MLALLFLMSIIIGWIMGIIIEKTKGTIWSRIWLIFAVVLDLGILFYFKYCNFFIENFNSIFKSSVPLLNVVLPIGISFYTFQLLSYKVDVFRGTAKAQKNLIDFGTYVSMFPQLIAGPIVRYSKIESQLQNRTHSIDRTYNGLKRFLIGFAKKVLIANTLAEIGPLFRSSSELSILYYWLYAISFMLQIYYDFSGYSDMAIGLGTVFGFDFDENFQYPYISRSITEFWRRWHISLGSWFRDYVYIPLGGNRKGICRQLFNITIVWMLTGFWHGASWNFILWGIFFAVLLIAEKLFLSKFLSGHRIFSHLYVLFFVMTGFVLFNAPDLRTVISDISGLFAFGKIPLLTAESVYYFNSYGILIIAAIIGATPIAKQFWIDLNKTELRKVMFILEPAFLLCIFILGTAYLVDGSFNPFLYFRF